jgi:putative heme iron utilization protein
MEPSENTQRQQFVEDYLLVSDNNFTAYRLAMQMAKESGGSVPKMSDRLREQYESAISQVIERERRLNEYTADLLSQLLLGWGSPVFDDIARHYIDKDLENRLVNHLTSVLKTGN